MSCVEVFSVEKLQGYLEGRSGLRCILDGVDLRVRSGEPTALLGESGSGKTFLVHSVLGLHGGLPGVVSGRACVMGVDVFSGLGHLVRCRELDGRMQIAKSPTAWDRSVQRRLRDVLGRSVGLVPQDPLTTLPPFYSVGELMDRALRRSRSTRAEPERQRAAGEWLDRVHLYGVEEVLTSYPHELSGGMAQRVALALALAPEPELLIADEPTTGLDATLRVRVLELLAEAVHDLGATLFLITHDTEAVRLLTARVEVLCAGRIVEQGPTERVLDPKFTPKHPYTRYLLSAEASLCGQRSAPRSAERPVETEPGGCRYRSHCPLSDEECAARAPTLQPVHHAAARPDRHRVACWKEVR